MGIVSYLECSRISVLGGGNYVFGDSGVAVILLFGVIWVGFREEGLFYRGLDG